ncbi:hypothetical protein PPYR_00356 [Photinus pyralis]|uniref:OPA3-like protein n=1 Tax=Photinus pyralis TaxID=7054 RepID=A0A5N4B1F3_PHOPY|nr:putative OPA3-like protein CG13603 [Photinus pyralis]KAB0803386.1 hypothetical protein PPYR_00356 [Photinus pyralis]
MSIVLLKLGTILAHQFTKPFAYYLTEKAKRSRLFRNYVCLPSARIFHWGEVKAKMWMLSLGTAVQIPIRNEKMATELGANLFAEIIVFGTISSIVINEYVRTRKKDAKKEARRKQIIVDLKQKLEELSTQVQHHQGQLEELLKLYQDG